MAQPGSWQPAGADVSYPRTLLKAEAVAGVRDALATGTPLSLYNGLYASATAPVPTDNTSTTGRRTRATLTKNAAFVLLLNRQPLNGTLVALDAAGQAALLAKTKGLLESLNPNVEAFLSFTGTPYTEWQWRSKELIDYLIAYDLLRGAGETEASLLGAQTRLQQFAGNLYAQSTTPFFGVSFYNTIKNNHTLMTAAALGMAAVVLNHVGGSAPQQQPTNWMNTGMYHLDNVLWEDAQRQSDPTAVAGYAEGPYYFKYAFLNCLPFFRAMGHFLPDNAQAYTVGATTRNIRNPYYDPRYDRLYDWMRAIVLPDGRFPALEDSYVDMGMPELALTGKSRYLTPLHLHRLTGTPLASLTAQLRDITVDMRAAYLAANILPTKPANATLTVLPQSGNLIFRSGNDSLATYLHMYGKNGPAQLNSGGHNQGDASSFILHAQGQLLALDPGYLSFARRNEVGNAANHNLVLVDGRGPITGTPGATNDAPAFIRNTLQTPKLSYGEVQTAYEGATITRKTVFVRNTYFLLADFVQAPTAHTYTWQLHGAGLEGGTATTGTFTDNLTTQQAAWQHNGARLTAHVTAAGGATSYAKATNAHELTYNATANHTTLLVAKSGSAQTQFLAALYPSTTSEQPAITTTSTATTAGLASTGGGFQDVAFAQADTTLTAHSSSVLPEAVQADGLLAFYSADAAHKFAQAFLQAGTVLRYGPTAIVRSAKRATISWQQNGAGRYEGAASRATTLTLALPEAPARVSGPGVTAYRYETATQQLHVTLQMASSFAVTTGPGAAPLPVTLVRFTGQRQGQGVGLTWHTASEHQNQGFTIQRQMAPDAVFQNIGFVKGAGDTAHPTDYRFRDPAAPTVTTYYRLQQTDHSGAVTYSPVVAVAAADAPNPRLSVFPVPTQRELTVAFSTPATDVFLRLVNPNGQTVMQQHFRDQTQLDLSGLTPGLYYLQALDAAGNPVSRVQKIVVAR